MSLLIQPRQALRLGLAAISLLVGLHLVVLVLRLGFGIDSGAQLATLFDFDRELTFPAAYSTFQILACSLLMLAIGSARKRRGQRFATQWKALALVFLFLALDELLSLHERLGWIAMRFVPKDSPFVVVWVSLYGLLTLGLGAYFLRFVMGLPKPLRGRLLFAGSLYVASALGLELLGGLRHLSVEQQAYDVPCLALTTLEETGEMTAMLVLLWALLDHLPTEIAGFELIVIGARDKALTSS